jgi:hypothetical protein
MNLPKAPRIRVVADVGMCVESEFPLNVVRDRYVFGLTFPARVVLMWPSTKE